MYVMVDELVDFVFDGDGGAVVFLFEMLRNLYNQSGLIQISIQKKKLTQI